MANRKLTVRDVANEIGRSEAEVIAAAYDLKLGLEKRKPKTFTELERDLIRQHLDQKDQQKTNEKTKE
jgi:hypothetical protein